MTIAQSLLSSKTLGVAAAFLLAAQISPAYALTQSDLVNGGAVWLQVTIAVALVFMMSMAFSLQIARGYFIRILEKFTLRLGADIWWLAYVLIRDGLIFLSFITSLLVFLPGTFLNYDIAVPFMPLSTLLFGTALVTKLYFDADENRNAFRVVTSLVFLGTALWIFSVIFVTESPIAMASVSSPMASFPQSVVATNSFWYYAYTTFGSLNNIGLAIATFNITFVALGVLGVIGFAHPILHSRLRRLKMAVPSPVAPTPSSSPGISRTTVRGEVIPEHLEPRPAQQPDSLQASTLSRKERVDYIK